MPESSIDARIEKYSELTRFNRDFVTISTSCARTIVSELFVPSDEKTVRARPLAGIAGGKKFVLRGILFKVASGHIGPYFGSDEAAAKAVGHDLHGANHYFSVCPPGLHIAPQNVIDYKGYRIHAQALLPIDRSTLRVGTMDGSSTTVQANDANLMAMMEYTAKELNIAPHFVGKNTILYSAADLEGHVARDGRCYVVDLARSFPPESPIETKHLQCVRHTFALGQRVVVLTHPGDRKSAVGARVVSSSSSSESGPTHVDVLIDRSDDDVEGCDHPNHRNFMRVPISQVKNMHDMSVYWRLIRPEFMKTSSDSEARGALKDSKESASTRLMNDAVIVAASSKMSAKEEEKNLLGYEAPDFGTTDNEDEEETRSEETSDRPELLSPDAYTSFSFGAKDDKVQRRKVDRATRRLTQELLPNIAANLIDRGVDALEGLSIAEYLHRRGVNCRHIGLLRELHRSRRDKDEKTVDNAPTTTAYRDVQCLLLTEVVSRTMKNVLRYLLRETMKVEKSPSEEGLIDCIVTFLNRASGATSVEAARIFWQSTLPRHVATRFGPSALGEQSKILDSIFLVPQTFRHVVLRILQKCGIQVSPTCLEQLETFAKMSTREDVFEFSQADVIELKPVVKQMQVCDLSEGIFMSLLAQRKETLQDSPRVVVRLADSALKRLGLALRTLPDDAVTRNAYADALQTKAFALEREFFSAERLECDAGQKATEKEVEDRKLNIRDMFARARILRRSDFMRCHRTGVDIGDDMLGWDCTRSSRHMDSMPNFQTHTRPISWVEWTKTRSNAAATHFLPLVVNEEHYARGRRLLLAEIFRAFCNKSTTSKRPIVDPSTVTPVPLNRTFDIDGDIFDSRKTNGFMCLCVIANAMNGTVLRFARESAASSPTSSDGDGDAVFACYTRLHFMLLRLAEDFPEMIQYANDRVRKFIDDPSERSKQYNSNKGTKNLGVWLIYLLISDVADWNDRRVREAYFQESLARNSYWALRSEQDCSLIVLENDPVCAYRLTKCWRVNKTSYRILMFQSYFVRAIAARQDLGSSNQLRRARVLELYKKCQGRTTKGTWIHMREESDRILAVDSFATFLSRIELSRSPHELTVDLRNAMRTAHKQGYLNNIIKKRGLKHVDPAKTQASQFQAAEATKGEISEWTWARVASESTPEYLTAANPAWWRRTKIQSHAAKALKDDKFEEAGAKSK
eukprot:g3992.t1